MVFSKCAPRVAAPLLVQRVNAARKMSREQLGIFLPWLLAERPDEVAEILADLGFKR